MVLHFKKLRLSLLVLVQLVILPSMILLILYTSWQQQRNSRVQAQQTALRFAQIAAIEQERLITGTHYLLMTLAELFEVRERRAEDCNEIFANIMKKFPYLANIGAVTPDGDIFCSGLPIPKTVNIADRPYFQEAIKERRLAVSHLLFGRMSGKPNITVAYPSFNADGTVRGLMFARLDLTWLNSMAAKVEIPLQSIFMALDEEGAIFARHPEPEKWLGKKADQQLVRTIVEQKEGLTEAEGADGIRRLYGFTTLNRIEDNNALYVAVGIPDAVAFADANRIFYRSLIVLLAVSLLGAVSTWFGAHFLVRRRLENLVAAARALGEIEIDQTASTSPRFSKGRVGQYAEVIEEMWESLHKIMTRQVDFSAMIAHDLRNPIQMIKLTASVLSRDKQLSEGQKELVDSIQISSDELARIISDFMDFSKLKGGYLRLDKREINVKEFIQDIKQKYSLVTRNRQLQLKTTVDSRIGPIYVDRQKIEQLIGNLVGNALKFTPAGGEIEIGARRAVGGLEIWVKDTGIGIASEEMQILFSRYHQTASGKKSQEEGTGLGLLICKMIADSHGGRIWVESELNHGATFFVWIPNAAESYRPTGT